MSGMFRLAFLWALLILLLCLMPGSDLPQWQWADLFQVDKVVHIGVFAVQAMLLYAALHKQYGHSWSRSKRTWTTLALCILYGISLEVMQGSFIEGRSADPLDAVADGLGALVGLVYLRRQEERRSYAG